MVVSLTKSKQLDKSLAKYEKMLSIRHKALELIVKIDKKVMLQKIKSFKAKIERIKSVRSN